MKKFVTVLGLMTIIFSYTAPSFAAGVWHWSEAEKCSALKQYAVDQIRWKRDFIQSSQNNTVSTTYDIAVSFFDGIWGRLKHLEDEGLTTGHEELVSSLTPFIFKLLMDEIDKSKAIEMMKQPTLDLEKAVNEELAQAQLNNPTCSIFENAESEAAKPYSFQYK